jgi:hypothetical protein
MLSMNPAGTEANAKFLAGGIVSHVRILEPVPISGRHNQKPRDHSTATRLDL